MSNEEFKEFHTELGYVMKLLKHQAEDADKLMIQEGHRKISSEAVHFLNTTMNLKLELQEERGGIDMCKAQDRNNLRREVTGAIKGMQMMGASNTDILKMIMEYYHVTKEYVLDLLSPQEA